MKATPKQIAKIWVLAQKISLGPDVLHDFVFSVTGERHISALNSIQAGNVLKEMERYFGKNFRISGSQRAKIFRLMYELGWNKNRVDGLVRKMTGIDRLEWLTKDQAMKITEALKAIARRQHNEIQKI